MVQEYWTVLFVISLVAAFFSFRTTFLASFKPDRLRREIDGRAKKLTDAYPATKFWRNASITKIRKLVSFGFMFILLADFLLYKILF